MKNNAIRMGEGDSMIIQAHLAFMEWPHPFLWNLPYGADTKKSTMNTNTARLKITTSE
jgi:hypothetical protein